MYSIISTLNTVPVYVFFVMMLFSALMFWDCLKRENTDFLNHFNVKNGEYDKLLWLIIIVIAARLYGIGAIAYYALVKKTEKKR